MVLRRRVNVIAVVFFISICIYGALHTSSENDARVREKQRGQLRFERPLQNLPEEWPEQSLSANQHGPQAKAVPGVQKHPIQYLMDDARRRMDAMAGRQSRDLEQAVKEYRRRYGIPPPPHFDKWFEFARDNNVQLVDEFDMIHELLTPFWGLRPRTIRSRVKEALGFNNALLGVAIRNHQISHSDGDSPEWQTRATHGMLQKFLQYLPDMDLAFNICDEPRVIVPHDDLTRLVQKARQEHMLVASAAQGLVNDFSRPSPALSDGLIFEPVKLSRFNTFRHEATWTHSRMSCPPDSPARMLEEDERLDDVSQYGMGELGFVFNSTAMADICLSPSLSSTYGFFDRPNRYQIVHDLFPIFSQSKLSSYNDIIYPSPWYWDDKVQYKQKEDAAWDDKGNSLYWRGSTTGGFSRDGGWRRQHRQRLVKKLNAGGQAKIMVDVADRATSTEPDAQWTVRNASRADFSDLIDVAFSHIGQCDDGDCQAQRAFFGVKDSDAQTRAWSHKFLLDIDGNAFSGRFLAFLKSASLTFKFALFREWHTEWLMPWVHYVPLSLQGEDWLETLRFFNGSGPGAEDAKAMAAESRQWAAKAMRKEDMEVWFFRLLLEYARVIDDQRDKIGFDPLSSNERFV